MSNKVTNEPKYITNKDVNIFQNQKINASKVEKAPATSGKKTDSTSKDTALLKQRASDPVSAANKTSLQSNMQKRNELLSDMSNIIFGNIVSKDQTKSLKQETEIARKKHSELWTKGNALDAESRKIKKQLDQTKDKSTREKISEEISSINKERSRVNDETRAAYADYQKLNSLLTCSDLTVSMALAPKILEAVESGNFTSDFIDSLCDKFSLIQPIPSYLLNVYKQLRQMSSDAAVLKAFNDNVKDYLQQSNGAKNKNSGQQFVNNAKLFIYNTIAFPYQRKGEGSCCLTATAIAIYHNQKINYMKILRGIIDENIVAFSCLGNKVAPIKVDNFGLDCNEQDVIYQKLISAIAELCPSVNKIHTKTFDQQIKKICESLGKTTAEIISDGLLSHGLVWSHYKIPAVCAFSDILKTRADVIAHIEDTIKKIIADHDLDKIEERIITEIAKKIFTNVKDSGGFVTEVASNLSGGTGGQMLEIPYSPQVLNSIFKSAQIQKILDGLEYGNFSDRSQRLRPGQSVVATYITHYRYKEGKDLKEVKEAHTFTLLAGHYDINSMAVGDKVRIGHMNYPDNAYSDSYIYLVKVADNQFQLMHKERPIDGALKRIRLFPDLATEYEPVPKPAAPKPITREIKINPAPTFENPTVINKIKVQKPKREHPNGANSTNPKVPAIVEPAKKTPNIDKPNIDRPLPKKSTDKPTISLSTKKSITFSGTPNVKPVANSPVSVKKINAKTEINTPIVSKPTQNRLVVVKKLNDPTASGSVQNEPKGNNNRMSLSKMNGNHRHTDIPNGQKNNITPRSQRNEATNTRMSLSRMNGNHRNLDIPSSSRANTPASRPQRNEPAAIDNRISLSKMNNNYKRVSTKGGFAHETPNTSVNRGVPSKNSRNNHPPRPKNNQPKPGNIRRNH